MMNIAQPISRLARAERLARRVVRATEPKRTDQEDMVEKARTEAQVRYQRAIDDFIAAAKREAAQKKRSRRDREVLIGLFLMLMLDAGEEASANAYSVLEDRELPLHERKPTAKQVMEESTEFASQRSKYLRDFPARALAELEQSAASQGPDERLARKAIESRGEQIKQGEGKTVAETEAQCTVGDAQRRVLVRAGYKTKRWLTMNDERVRESHERCQHEGELPMDKRFSNGLLFPGDPHGTPEELINCRCVLVGGRR